jgi:hypothetical protein
MLELLEKEQTKTDIVDDVDDTDLDLYKEASQILHYHVPFVEVTSKDKRGQVVSKLNEMGIDVFTNESVQKYKEKMAPRMSDIIPGIIFSTLFCTGITAAILSYSNDIANMIGMSLCCLLPSIAVTVIGATFIEGRFYNKQWRKYRIQQFFDPIPEFAIQTAVDIKKSFSNSSISCELYIDRLEKGRGPWKDPFLIAEIDGQEYYVEVWNEPDYKVEREQTGKVA